MLVKTERVKNIIYFVEKMGVADALQITQCLFPKYKGVERDVRVKLTKMCEEGLLKRKKTFLGTRYIYFVDQFPVQFEHKYLLTELVSRLSEKFGNENVTCEPTYSKIKGMRPSGYVTVKHNGYKYPFFVEVHLSNNKFNYQKYIDCYNQKQHIHLTQDAFIFPTILVITDKKVEIRENLDVIKIDTQFTNFSDVFGEIKTTQRLIYKGL